MKDYRDYSAVDLASDDDFMKWVKSPHDDQELSDFWNEWIGKDPEKDAAVKEAKTILAQFQDLPKSENSKSRLWARIEDSIDQLEADESTTTIDASAWSWRGTLKYAAAAVVLLTAGWFFYGQMGEADVLDTLHLADVSMVQNPGTKPKSTILPDGSSVVLYENTSIELLDHYGVDNRSVKIRGKAYFEVKRDESRPFIVHAEGLTTKVLGTSFVVSAYDKQDVTVSVNTGQVSVYQVTPKGEPAKEVMLKKNESASLQRMSSSLERVEAKLDGDVAGVFGNEFEIENQSLPEVFEALKKHYGVEIEYSRKNLKDCLFNASLVGIPLEDKIRLICKGGNLKYKIDQKLIVISGAGCQGS